MGLRNARINFRQMEVSHSMENAIYNELRIRGYRVDVGNLNIVEKGNKGSKKYYIQSAYLLETEAKAAQELRPLLKINDSFKKIVITSNTPNSFYSDEGILMMICMIFC